MPDDPAFAAAGTFYRGNLHTHSNRSDGALDPGEVCRHYREAGYDFLCLSDHFLPRYGFPLVDTRPWRTNAFTTLIGAEVHAPQTALGETWHVLAVGLPDDFAPLAAGETGAAIAQRCVDAGAYVVIAHPAWYGLTIADADAVPGAHAVEIYNHTCQVRTDRGDGTYLADQILAAGRRIHLCAVDDAHFHCSDSLGGAVMVKAASNEPAALLAALKAGAFYSTQGPLIEDVRYLDDQVEVACSPASSIMVLGRGSRAAQWREPGATRAVLPLEKLRAGGYARVVVADDAGRRAWTNPVWF